MKVLISRELLVAKLSSRSYISIFMVFGILGVVKRNIIFFDIILGSLALRQVLNSFAYEDKNGWNELEISTSLKRKDIVITKYLISYTILFISLIITVLTSYLIVFMGNSDNLLGLILENYHVFYVIGFIIAFLIPLLFKLGMKKSRNYILPIVGVVLAIGTLVFRIVFKYGLNKINNSKTFLISFLIFIVIIILSYILSIKIYSEDGL